MTGDRAYTILTALRNIKLSISDEMNEQLKPWFEDIENAVEDEQKVIKALSQKSGKWIPVSERLPEDSGEYLIAIEDRYYNKQRFDLSWFYSREKVWSLRSIGVIAWMPLPEPYEPQEVRNEE